MKTKILTGAAVAVFCAGAFASDDFQLWLKLGAEGALSDSVKIKAEEELKFQDDASEFYDEETLMMLEFSCTDWMSVGVGCKIVQERKNTATYKASEGDGGAVEYKPVHSHYWREEVRPTVDLTLKHDLGGWKFDNRLRFEVRDKDDGSDTYMRYRDRIRVRSPWKFTALEINPYASWELFIEDADGLSGSDMFNRHRSQIGVSANFTENLSGGLYALVQADKSDGDWDSFNVLGIECTAKF